MINLTDRQIEYLEDFSTNLVDFAVKVGIDIPDFISSYSNNLSDFTLDELPDCCLENEKEIISDYISEYADSRCPVYWGDIDSEYDNCDVSIDDVIEEGIIEAMYSESDIYKAKQSAVIVSLDRKTREEVEQFFSDLESYFDNTSRIGFIQDCLKVVNNE